MKLLYTTVLLVLGYTVGEEISEEKESGNLHREKKDIAKLEALLGLKRPYISGYQEARPAYAPLCNCWRPATRPYGNEDSVVVYPAPATQRPLVLPAQPALLVSPQPAQPAFAAPAQPALVAPPRPAEPAYTFNAPALVSSGGPQPCHPGYSYDRPVRSFNH